MKYETGGLIETGLCLTAVIRNQAVPVPTHLLVEGDHKDWCITTAAAIPQRQTTCLHCGAQMHNGGSAMTLTLGHSWRHFILVWYHLCSKSEL